jgi:hypothetical protein
MLRRTRSHARTMDESVDLTTRLNFYLQYTTRMHVALTWAGGADVAARRRERMSSAESLATDFVHLSTYS